VREVTRILPADEIQVFINGEPQSLPTSASIAGLLKYLQLPLDRVAVELNKTLVRKRDWDATRVENGSRLEIVEFVGGG
jgi:thiamine biosynthesis protein ThiS